MIEIDGGEGEAGGQIVRTSLALSSVTGEACRIRNIRKGRPNPGLQAQHLESVNALARLCNAEISGASLHSSEIEFHPKEIKGGHIDVNIPTAGSVALVLQGIMIASLHAKKDVSIQIYGGATNGKWAPSVFYIKNVLLPILSKMGYEGYIDVERYGYYPRGGAKLSCTFVPKKLRPLEIMESGKIISIQGISHASKTLEKNNVAVRQKSACMKYLKKYHYQGDVLTSYFDTLCEGSAVDIWVQTESSFLGVGALGEREKSAETVGSEAGEKLDKLLGSKAALDEHAEDQLLPYMALVGESMTKYHHLTNHTRTNISIIEKFLPVKFIINEKEKTISCEKM
ncbi:MAG: RNA 3'-terminal phosphate cyclase [Candidatus Aenigmarchaeota archaeon]|nr:RNA 3'-terminal phosphate cyclase [Candidatus Aenigmarchaeota archaeon]MDI6722056.1 RNA 3'-terminal phosphate cyclase [Candidatus Aenigmarchaeota archaeon]